MSAIEAKQAAQFFTLKSPLLSAGKRTTYVAQSDLMSISVKIYASGGENKMHMHPQEEHSFIVLQGQATFHIERDDNVKILNKNEGVMLPKGTCYWFLSSAPENLVLLRIGAAEKPPEVWRAFPDGTPFDEAAKKSGRSKPEFDEGHFFGG